MGNNEIIIKAKLDNVQVVKANMIQRGLQGETGNGIEKIEKTGTSYNVDTYTIYYTDGTTSTFDVTNGVSITDWQLTSTVGLVDTYTISMSDGTKYYLNITNGKDGADGAAAVISHVNASVSNTVGTPACTVTTSGTTQDMTIDFAFSNLKGEKGDKGDKGDSGNSIFYANYYVFYPPSSTPVADIQAAYAANNTIFCNVIGNNSKIAAVASLNDIKSNGLEFEFYYFSQSAIGTFINRIYVDSEGNWTYSYKGLQDTSNKVNTISDTSTNSQYPSAKAVYDSASSKIHPLKGYLENGTLYSDTELYNNVYAYAHSTTITGTDTIKSDDYTVVGSPTITDLGIASGFSSSNKISKTISLSGSKLVAKCGFSYAIPSAQGVVFGFLITGTSAARCYVDTSGNLNMYIPAATNETLQILTTDLTMTAGDLIIVEGEWNESSTCTFKATNITTGQSATKTGTANWNKTIESLTSVYIGSSGSNNPYSSSVDLNLFQIYVDGSLVYQPCLKIPYTLSNTGSKIVDVAYRERVIDVYNQFGSANYYIIDETNQKAALPLGEVYGMSKQSSMLALSLPTGNTTTKDGELYGYIKGLYDKGLTITDNSYTNITGTLTITDKGVASGFSSSKYITLKPFAPSGDWEMNVSFMLTASPSATQVLVGRAGGGGYFALSISSTLLPACRLSTNSNTWDIGEIQGDTALSLNVKYNATVRYKSGVYSFYIDDTLIGSVTSSSKINTSNNNLLLGAGFSLNNYFDSGSIYLNSFNIKESGVTTFQGKYLTCNVVSTGSKVVDVAYKDCVDEIFNASGSALYYVLDTSNQTVTLPRGDIFGFITQAMS